MKIKFNSDDNLPLNKQLKFHSETIIVRSVKKMVTITLKFSYMSFCMKYKNVTI